MKVVGLMIPAFRVAESETNAIGPGGRKIEPPREYARRVTAKDDARESSVSGGVAIAAV